MKELTTIKALVLNMLIEKPKTRDNDIELIYQVLKKMGLPTDIKELKKLDNNILETIRRWRALLQKENPNLMGDEKVRVGRKAREEKFRKLVKGV